MTPFDSTIEDVATRFELGPKAGPLLRELLLLITGSPGGIRGFIDKFKSVGLSREASGWLGNPYGTTLTPSQVEKALGNDAVNTIARKVGLDSVEASTAVGYLVPKVVGKLTPDGIVNAGTPSSVSDFLRSSTQASRPDVTIPPGIGVAGTAAKPGRWIAPLLALLALAGIGWYLLNGHEKAPVATTSTSESAMPSRLAIANNGGVITVSGTVRDEATRASIIDTLKSVFGANAVKGDIAVDAKAGPTPWLSNLRAAFDALKTPGSQIAFEGNSLNLGGTLGDADRDRILGSLKSLFGPSGLTVAAADGVSNLVREANNKALAALSSLGTGFQATNLIGILNKSIINFPTGSADIPAINQTLLQRAATNFKQLPAGTVIEISGYTDNTGDQGANLQLSQHRADSVRNTLIQSGVNPAMLVAKGYGSGSPVASNDTAEGRFQNRRIDYEVVKH